MVCLDEHAIKYHRRLTAPAETDGLIPPVVDPLGGPKVKNGICNINEFACGDGISVHSHYARSINMEVVAQYALASLECVKVPVNVRVIGIQCRATYVTEIITNQ